MLLGDLKKRRLDFEEFSLPFGFKTKIGSELANIFAFFLIDEMNILVAFVGCGRFFGCR